MTEVLNDYFVSVFTKKVGGNWMSNIVNASEIEPTMLRKRCARPTILTSSEKKTRRQIIDKRVAYTRIYLGNQIGRWLTLREKLDFKSDTDLAGFLLDLYDNDDPLPKEAVVSLPEDMRIVTAKEERDLHDSSSAVGIEGDGVSSRGLTRKAGPGRPKAIRISRRGAEAAAEKQSIG
ncbi:zinc finger protein 692-like isoform X3 [Chrysemys picta bellii]|uniref:zinc finger protein 692-like isoform X3 n=1 Tax=Chrysemys picta bellii TaxID=8478 RepID=UPI0032B1B008